MTDADAVKARASEYASLAKEEAEKAYAMAKELGFFSHFKEYSTELITPWTYVTGDPAIAAAPSMKDKALVLVDKAKNEVISTVKLERSADVRTSFKLYNVLAFWCGAFESLIYAAFGGSLLSLTWNGGLGFIIAYTLYWTMLMTESK